MAAFLQYLRIEPYVPDRTVSLGDNTDQFSDSDVGKAVKVNTGGYFELCASGDNIYGVIQSLNVATSGGHSVGTIACDVNRQAYAADEAGTLSRGDLVSAGTAVALGTAVTHGPNVIVDAAVAAPHLWEVVEVYGTGAGRKCLIQKVG